MGGIGIRANWIFFKNGLKVFEGKNIITDTGLNFFAERIKANNVNFINFCGVGSNTNLANASDIVLGSEITRVVLSSKIDTGGKVEFLAHFPTGVGTGTWKEAGLFNEASAGSLINRINIDFVKNVGDSANIIIKLEFFRL